MRHDDLIEVLSNLTTVLERVEENQTNLATVLAQWDHDQKHRYDVQSQAIQRNRERLTGHAARIAKLESGSSKADSGGIQR